MSVETLFQWSQLAGSVIAAASGLGIVAGILYIARAYWQRRRWRTLATLVEDWAQRDFRAGGELPEEHWRMLAANWLTEAEFSATESIKLLEFAVLYAKGRTDFVLRRIAEE
jgi:hypothetical protein